MRQAFERRPAGRQQADFIVDRKGRTRRARARVWRRSPLLAFALAGAAGIAFTSPELALGDALLASGRAAAQGSEMLLASARAAVLSAADLIRSRSPGARTAAHLIKIKHAPAPRAAPVARAKPRLRAPAVPVPPAFVPPAALPLAFNDAPIAPAWTPVGAIPAAPVPGGAPCLCDLVYIPPLIGGGGVVIGGGGGGVNPPPPPPPGVPEPQSWGMMIIGFTVIGALWRRRRAILAAILKLPLLTYVSLRRLTYAPNR